MHTSWFRRRMTRLEFVGFLARTVLALSLVAIVSGAPAAYGLWLPWASDQDKIGKKLNDIWSALVNNNERALRQYLSGKGTQAFIDQERQIIKTFKITGYHCTVKRVQFDPSTKNWAFVEFERIGSTKGGTEKTDRLLRIMKKEGREWKLITDVKRHRDRRAGQQTRKGTVGQKTKSQPAQYNR